MVLNEDTTVYGFSNVKREDLQTKSQLNKFYGLQYPLGKDTSNGYFSTISSSKLFKANLTQLVRTSPGERFMQPNYGLNLKRYLFEPVTPFLLGDMRSYITNTIKTYAPYLEVQKIELTSKDRSSPGFIANVIIKLYCRIKSEEETTIEVKLEV